MRRTILIPLAAAAIAALTIGIVAATAGTGSRSTTMSHTGHSMGSHNALTTADLRVSLNGTAARCRDGSPPCEWSLPVEAMRTGLNVITLHSQTVPAPAPETRQLGLMVRRLALVRP